MIKMMKNIILMALLLSIVAIGCQKQAASPVTAPEATDASAIESGMSDIDSVNADLNTQELDSIESDLDKIDW
ncbi:MAG: hypothetical protein KKC75_02805 [Nanoarchaeota archaeon]|nr:hypothetical protein [Nanoarchaeota archaeon]MBU1005758.1 hypothetical protein [Nanoarchaeota archaeon]MBU1946629.1 hypothetical protein [Nanoarchaeota archaeon]